MKKYYLKNYDKIFQKTKDCNENNPEKVKQDNKKYNKQNRDKIITRQNEYFKNRTKTDINFRIIRITR